MSEVINRIKSDDSSSDNNVQNSKELLPVYGNYGSGMYQVIAAMMANIDSIQNYDSEGLMPLSQAILTQSEAYANSYIEEMSDTNNPNSDLSKLNKDIDPNTHFNSDQDRTNQISVDVQAYNLHNTEYNQSNTYFSGTTNGLNQSSSDTTQTISVDLQMYQDGPLSQMQNLTQIL